MRLFNTGDELLCEASAINNMWTAGLDINDSDVYDFNKWKGENLLGKVLMDVRYRLFRELTDEEEDAMADMILNELGTNGLKAGFRLNTFYNGVKNASDWRPSYYI